MAAMCSRCGGKVHTRYGNGGGGNTACPTTIPTPQLTEQAREQRTRLVMDLGSKVLATFGPDSAAVFLDHAARYVETGEDDGWRRRWAAAS